MSGYFETDTQKNSLASLPLQTNCTNCTRLKSEFIEIQKQRTINEVKNDIEKKSGIKFALMNK